MKQSSIETFLSLAAIAGLGTLLEAAPCEPELRPLVAPLALAVEAPQGIAIDETDGSLWICSALSNIVLRVTQDLRVDVAGSFAAPFEEVGRREVSGIAYRPLADTLLLVQPVRKEIWEVRKDCAPTGLVVPLADLPRPVNIIPEPYPKGIAFDPGGNGGAGSIWLVEAVMTAIYEVSLEGSILASFCHPHDPDGCPGKGAAAHANDIELRLAGGRLSGFELVGGRQRRDLLVAVDRDGLLTGQVLPLGAVGGAPGGFANGLARDPASGQLREVLFVTVESSAELHVLEVVEPDTLPIDGLTCRVEAGVVGLEWSNPADQTFDRIEVRREGELIATLPGAVASYSDSAAPDGVLAYEVTAVRNACRSEASCRAVTGAGEVLNSVPFDGERPVAIAEDAGEFLWITDGANQIFVYDKDLLLAAVAPSPFQGEEDVTSAIAFHAAGAGGEGSLFIYNSFSNQVAEIDLGGVVIGEPFPSGVPSEPEDEALVTAMLHNPGAEGGAGSFLYLDYTTGSIQERSRAGGLIRECFHPDHRAEVPPARSYLNAYAWGLTAVPGSDFQLLEMSGGRVRDRRTTRILRVGWPSCEPTGSEVPVEGVAAAAGGPVVLGIHRTTHQGRAVLYAVPTVAYQPRIFEIAATPRSAAVPPHVTRLACSQDGPERAVQVRFTPPGGLDAIEVFRDGTLAASLPSSAGSFVDQAVAEGVHTYEVRGLKGAGRSDGRACSVRVGPGSLAGREFTFPVSYLHQLAYDAAADRYLAASYLNRLSEYLYRFDPGLRYLGPELDLPSPFREPMQIAALAVRDAGGRSEYFCMGWNPGAANNAENRFPLVVIDAEARPLRSFNISAPRPRGELVVYPSGMAWDAATDTLWYLERNSATVVNITLEGVVRATFPHPSPPYQDFVYNYGFAVDGARNTLYLSSAGPLDHQVTKVVEVTRRGRLTGVEIPIGWPDYERLWGFALNREGTAFAVSSSVGSVSDLGLFRAFDPVRPIAAVACVPEGAAVNVSWRNGEDYDAVLVYRQEEPAAALPGAATSWRDEESAAGRRWYRLVGRKGAFQSAGAVCEPLFLRPFVRADVEENGRINLSDAVAVFAYLFTGGRTPLCLDAADVTDDGLINITDGISVLNYLFLNGREPRPPFPGEGLDPTVDGMVCEQP